MRKIRILLYALLLPWLFIQPVKADYAADDSCTQTNSIMNAILDITTLGLFDAYSESFHMYGAGGYGGSSSDGINGCFADYYPDNCAEGVSVSSSGACMHNSSYCQPNGTNCCPEALNDDGLPISSDYIGVPCPSGTYLGECDPNGGVEFCYDNYNFSTLSYQCNGNENAPAWTGSDDNYSAWYLYPPGQLRVITIGDAICVQFSTTLGYQSIGCKYLPSCSQFYLSQDCFVAPSCYSYTAQYSLALIPITGAIMQCINDTVQFLFNGNTTCADMDYNEYNVTTFSIFQGQMRSAVRSVLMLYVVLLGLKMVLGSELSSKGEFFRMGAKFALVLYFSTGININGVVGTDGQPYYDDGIHRYMIPLFTTGAAELADMVYTAGGSAGLCLYDSSLYPSEYSYLSMWDSIDCRLLYYIGFPFIDIGEDTTIPSGAFNTPTLFNLILPALFSFQLIFLFCSIIFVIMFLSVMIYLVNISVISAIIVAILIYIAPVFVPMALFEATKGYYEGWLKTSISYALQPMMVSAYVAMMLTIFDQTMFGDCVFQNNSVTFQSGGQEKVGIPFFVICDPHNSSGNCYNCADNSCPDYQTAVDTSNENITQCDQTIGYFLNPSSADISFTTTEDAVFFNITVLKSSVVNETMTGLVTLCLFAYIFYKFSDVLSEITSELSGGAAIGSAAGKPMALVDKAGDKMKAFAKYAASSSKKPDKPDKPGNPEKSKARSSVGNSKSESGAKSSSSNSKKQEKPAAKLLQLK